MKTNGTDRPIPKPLSFYAQGTQIWNFTLKQRLAILFGHRLLVNANFWSQHNPGSMSPILQLALTPYSELVPALADKAKLIPVAAIVPVLDEKLEIALDRFRENAAKLKAGAN